MRVCQFVHTLNYGDAISNEALTIKRLLLAEGIRTEIFALAAHERVKDEMKHWTAYEPAISVATGDSSISQAGGSDQEIILLHYSIGSPLNEIFRSAVDARRLLVYHNLTPVKWFSSYNARVAQDLVRGREEIGQLLTCADRVLADSSFNRQELKGFGCEDADVLPLVFDEEKWNIPANAGIVELLHRAGATHWLHVGRFAPNKCIEDIIKAFYFYHHKINQNSYLWLIGSDVDTEIYSFELRRLVERLRLKESVNFVGAVSDCELRAFYENCHVYLCMSEHEGFCVPLIEAMHFGLPIIAFDSSAIGETLGNGGILLAEKSPAIIAEIVNILLNNKEQKTELIKGGRERVRAFGLADFRRRLLAALS